MIPLLFKFKWNTLSVFKTSAAIGCHIQIMCNPIPAANGWHDCWLTLPSLGMCKPVCAVCVCVCGVCADGFREAECGPQGPRLFKDSHHCSSTKMKSPEKSQQSSSQNDLTLISCRMLTVCIVDPNHSMWTTRKKILISLLSITPYSITWRNTIQLLQVFLP